MAFATASAPSLLVGRSPRVNLLPRAVTERRERASLLRKWGIRLLAVVAVVALAGVATFVLQAAAAVRLVNENARTLTLTQELAALQPINQKIRLETELEQFRAAAMGTDLLWAGVLDTVRLALPVDVAITDFSFSPGGLVEGGVDPATQIGAQGTVTFSSATPADIVALVRALRAQNGVLAAEAVSSVLEESVYTYTLSVALDQTIYTGAYIAEAGQ